MADSNEKLMYLMPTKLDGSPEIEKQDITLIIDLKTEGLGGACRAKLLFLDGHSESCFAVRKSKLLAFETFQALNACSHPNIAKPLGFWEAENGGAGYIAFQNFDGILSSVPKEDIFEIDGELEGKSAMYGFSKTGINVMRDVVSAVKYVNDNYQQETAQTKNCIPLKSLSIEADTIFYQLKADGDYLVLLSLFDNYVERNTQEAEGAKEKAEDVKEKPKTYKEKATARKKEKKAAGWKGGKARKKVKDSSTANEDAEAGNPGEEPDVQKICSGNWNSLGEYIAQLYGDCSANFEVKHLVGKLKEEAVKYDDLVWEAGLWDLSTKSLFIREIFWSLGPKYEVSDRRRQLYAANALGLQICMVKFGVKQTIKVGTPEETKVPMQDSSLFKSLEFLRTVLVAHQAKIMKENDGPKVDAEDQKAAERIVIKETADYMVKLIAEMRNLNWFKTSPYLRSGHGYMIEFQENKIECSSVDLLSKGSPVHVAPACAGSGNGPEVKIMSKFNLYLDINCQSSIFTY